MLGFRKIRQLEPIVPTTGYLIPVASPTDMGTNETFMCAISDAIITTKVTYDKDSNQLVIVEKPKAFVFEPESKVLYCGGQVIGAADYEITEIDIQINIVDVIPQTDAANCIITCPQHGFLDFDDVEIFNVDITVNQKWEIEVIDDDSFFLKGTRGSADHANIYPGEGGLCWKRGGYRLDIYQKEYDTRKLESGLSINLSTVKEVYYDKKPALYLNIDGENAWGRVEGIL